MKKINENYPMLKVMYEDDYFPKFLVDKLKDLILPVIELLESGETDKDVIQRRLDEMTIAINNLNEEFQENDSDIETAARESIAETVEYILKWFGIDIDIETAIRERWW